MFKMIQINRNKISLFAPICAIYLIFILTSCKSDLKEVNQNASKNANSYENYVSYYRTIPDNEAGKITKTAITKAGGWENWVSKKAIKYERINISYDSITGDTSRIVREVHEYNLFPTFKGKMTWKNKDKNIVVLFDGLRAVKIENGVVLDDEKSRSEAWNNIFGSLYLIGLPFKMSDPGSVYNDMPPTTLANGKTTKVVKITYQEGAGSFALYHKWYYYFDPQTYQLAATLLDHGKGFGLNEYSEFIEVGGLKLQTRRDRYDSNPKGERLLHTNTYLKENIQFIEAFPDTHFEIPKTE